MKNTRNALAVATLAAIMGTDAVAQAVLEEVIVTAQKREESLQDTAIAITAFSGDMLDDLNVTSPGDYEAIVPSLSVREEPARLSLRGIGRVTNSLGTEPGIAVYVDQVYGSEINTLSRATSLTTERVEVLRGPQGTLFGRNATGGAVNVTSKRPTREFEHHIRATVGNYDTVNLGASSAGPITDSFGYRVYAYQQTRDGYIENQSGKDIWDLDNTGFGAQLSWDITDTLNLWVSYAKDETDDHRSGLLSPGVLITPYQTELQTQDGFFLSEQYQWDKTNPTVKDIYKIDYSDVLRARDDDNNKFTAHLTWDLDAMTVRYIGSYSENEFTGENGDFGFTSNPDVRGLESVEQIQDSSSHEIQFISESTSALQWVAGLYYWEEEKSQPYRAYTPTARFIENTVDDVDFLNPETLQANPGRDQVRQQADLDSESWAVYADLNYSFNERWKLTVGARYTEDKKTGFESQYIVADVLAIPGAEALIPLWQLFGFPENCCGFLVLDDAIDRRNLKDDWSNLSGRIVLDYMPSDDTLLYVSVANGYKAGGFNLGTLTPDPSFDEETLLSYEIGYKGTFNQVLRLNAAAYFYDYSDMQVRVPRLSDQNLPVQELTNAAESEVFGLELEATWLATENLALLFNYSYIDGEYTDFCCIVDRIGDPDGEAKDLSGNPLIQAPENKFYLNASYSIPTASMGEWVFSGSYAWVDERQYDVFNTPETRADSYYRLDGMVTWFSPSAAWRVILSGRNLTDEETYTSLNRLNGTGALTAWPNAPRTYSLEVQFDF
jgi:iron complex outermembrane receptor protein